MANQVTDETFERDVLQASNDSPVLVDFFADWCGPCHELAPHLQAVADELGSKLRVVKVDVEQNPLTPGNYGVRGIPTLILFKGGQVAATRVGNMPRSQLKSWIESVI